MKKTLFIVLIPFIFGCATIINGSKQKVLISSTPPDAQVMVDGTAQGKTPVKVDLKRKSAHSVIVSRDGYQTKEVQLERKVSGWVWGNIGFGGLIGLGIDAGTGSMYKLKPENVSLDLKKTDGDTSTSASALTATPSETPSTPPSSPASPTSYDATPSQTVVPQAAASESSEWKQVLKNQSVYVVLYQSGDHLALNVAKSFLEKLKSDHVLGNYQILDFIYQSDDKTYLKSGFAQGLVFDFKNIKGDKVRVRLIQFPEAKILWETSGTLDECLAK